MKLLINPRLWFRFLYIQFVLLSVLMHRGFAQGYLHKFASLFNLRSWLQPRGVVLRDALIKLGPIFVKFGQTLSTRRDILPDDVADELAKLQDKVPPFSGKLAKKIISKELSAPLTDLFAEFAVDALASASIAQVHAAKLHSGDEVVVKVLRPNVHKIIDRDLLLMRYGAKLLVSTIGLAKKLRLTALVAEFSDIINDELDLQREAANCSQMGRNFAEDAELSVPKIYWALTKPKVLVASRIKALSILDVKDPVQAVAVANGLVKLFFTQVFRDSFFHADMHPGNIFVELGKAEPAFILVDFGIVGVLNASDQYYLAENLLAFFERDYRRVASLHIECGWVPQGVRVDKLEAAIRADCEPIFAEPLQNISFADFLLRLFKTAENFDMIVQPQLLLLQKTLLNVEGLGRQLDPNLDLWATAAPVLKHFVKRERGLGSRLKNSLRLLPSNLEVLSGLPVLLQRFLQQQKLTQTAPKRGKFFIGLLVGVALACAWFIIRGSL